MDTNISIVFARHVKLALAVQGGSWQYLDSQGQEQGPFSTWEMRQLHRKGHLSLNLPIKYSGSDEFQTLRQMFPDPADEHDGGGAEALRARTPSPERTYVPRHDTCVLQPAMILVPLPESSRAGQSPSAVPPRWADVME